MNYRNYLLRSGFLIVLLCFAFRNGFSQSRSLSYFLEQAYANDPPVAASQRNMEIASLDKKINIAAFQKPSVSGNALALWAPGTNLWGFDKAVTNGGEYDALLNITYPLWQGSNLKAYNMVSLSQSKQASYNVRFRKHSLKRQVTQAYIRIYGDQQQITYLKQLDQLLQQQLKQWSGLVAGGLLNVTDVQQVRLEDEQVRIQQKQAQNQFKQDQAALNQLCGISDTTGYDVHHPALDYPAGSPDVQQSNFLRSFGIDSLSFEAGQKVKDASYLPQLDAMANGGLSSSNLRDSYHHFGVTVGLQLNWKLWDGGQKSLERQKTKLHLDNVRDRRRFEIKRLLQQRNALRQSLKDVTEQVADQQKQVKNYKKLLDVYRMEIDKGIRTVTDYVTVFRQYLGARNTLNNLNIQRLQTINELDYWNW